MTPIELEIEGIVDGILEDYRQNRPIDKLESSFPWWIILVVLLGGGGAGVGGYFLLKKRKLF